MARGQITYFYINKTDKAISRLFLLLISTLGANIMLYYILTLLKIAKSNKTIPLKLSITYADCTQIVTDNQARLLKSDSLGSTCQYFRTFIEIL
jgi:hypothetical protein